MLYPTHIPHIQYDSKKKLYQNTRGSLQPSYYEEAIPKDLRPYDQILDHQDYGWVKEYFQYWLGPKQLTWVKALESKAYRQGRGKLIDVLDVFEISEPKDILKTTPEPDVCYCCLGVAKVVCELPETSNSSLMSTFSYIGLADSEGKSSGTRKLSFWNGALNRTNIEPPNRTALVHLNDTVKCTFEQIAEVLRVYPDQFFREIV